MPNDIIGNTFPQAWNKLPDMVKTLSKLLKKKNTKELKIRENNSPACYICHNQ